MMKQRVWAWCRKALGDARFTVPYGNGGWITLDERDWLQGQIFVTGWYEREVWDRLAAFATSNEVVWDVGAHIGSIAIRALLDDRVCEVRAFEPDPKMFDILRMNLALNSSSYSIHRIAIGSRQEVRKLYRGPFANLGLSTLIGDRFEGGETVEVECHTVDELVFEGGLPPPTLMKIDVEGWEYEVLRGAQRLFREAPPKALVVEAACNTAGEATDVQLVRELERFGYLVEWIRRAGGLIEPRENLLAVRLAARSPALGNRRLD